MANYSIGVQGPGGHNAFLITQHIKTLAEGFDLQDHQPIRQLCDRLTSFGKFRYTHAAGGEPGCSACIICCRAATLKVTAPISRCPGWTSPCALIALLWTIAAPPSLR